MVGVWFVACVRNHAKYYHADYDTTVQLFTCTFMLSRAPFRSHALRDPFLSFALSSVNPYSPNCGNIAEKIGERSWVGKERKSGGSLLVGGWGLCMYIYYNCAATKKVEVCLFSLLCVSKFVIRLYIKSCSLRVICGGEVRRAIESSMGTPVLVVRSTVPVGGVTHCL